MKLAHAQVKGWSSHWQCSSLSLCTTPTGLQIDTNDRHSFKELHIKEGNKWDRGDMVCSYMASNVLHMALSIACTCKVVICFIQLHVQAHVGVHIHLCGEQMYWAVHTCKYMYTFIYLILKSGDLSPGEEVCWANIGKLNWLTSWVQPWLLETRWATFADVFFIAFIL